MRSANTEDGFVGSRPATYLKRLFCPVPSASAPGAAFGLFVLPKYLICQLWNGGSAVRSVARPADSGFDPPQNVVKKFSSTLDPHSGIVHAALPSSGGLLVSPYVP